MTIPTQRFPESIYVLFWVLALFISKVSLAQNFEVRNDVFDGVGGKSNSANVEVVMTGGQTAPVGHSQSANYDLSAGFIFSIPRAPTGVLIAEILCPVNFAQGCSITSQIKIDMTGMSPPDSLLAAFTGSISWDPALLQFTQHSGILSGFVGVVNTTNATNGIITFNGAHPLGVGGLIDMLDLDFDIIGSVGSNEILDLDFSDLRGINFQVLLPFATINDCAFTIIQPERIGDVSGDDLANSTDALIILSFDVGLPIPQQFLNRINAGLGDVNSDAQTNSTDALIILSYDAGITVPFPVGDPVCP